MSKRLGGSEESVVQWAQHLAKDHDVTVYHNGQHGTYRGVEYSPREEFTPGDITLNIKSHDFTMPDRAWYFTNETDAGEYDLSDYAGVIWPSKWAEKNIPVNNDTYVVPHGYNDKLIYPGEKLNNTVLYASSPDRGLDKIREIWPIVVEQVPDAHLSVTYGAAGDLPRATFLGEIDETQMNQLYRETDIWLHPCSGGELFGMTGIKAQAAGCIPVYYPTMALAETVQAGISTDDSSIIDDLVGIMEDGKRKKQIRKELSNKKFINWEESTRKLWQIIKQ